jgi:hypothetical protein
MSSQDREPPEQSGGFSFYALDPPAASPKSHAATLALPPLRTIESTQQRAIISCMPLFVASALRMQLPSLLTHINPLTAKLHAVNERRKFAQRRENRQRMLKRMAGA